MQTMHGHPNFNNRIVLKTFPTQKQVVLYNDLRFLSFLYPSATRISLYWEYTGFISLDLLH